MANNPYVNRVETADGTTLMDISDTTATEGDVISGKTLYKANGQKSVGTLDINGKADKVANATSGNFAGLDSNGNLTDSGSKASDFISDKSELYEGYISEEQRSIATFSAKNANNLMRVKVGIDPVQDLHGYENPWPAGGGKNLLPPYAVSQTIKDVTFTINSDGTISTNGTASGTAILYLSSYVDLWADGNYILNGCPSGGGDYKYALRMYETGGMTYVSDDGSGVQFNGKSNLECAIVVWSGQNVNGLVFKPMIRLSTVSDATYAPYSNICPITGWTGAKVNVAGKNLISYPYYETTKEEHELTFTDLGDGRIKVNGTASSDTTFIIHSSNNWNKLKAGTYKLTGCPDGGGMNTYQIYAQFAQNDMRDYGSGATVTYTDGVTLIGALYIAVKSGVNVNNLIFKPMLSLDENAVYDSFEPYSDNEYSITFPSSAGTVYGGTLTINKDGSGELVVTDYEVDLGTLDYYKYDVTQGTLFRAGIPGIKTVSAGNIKPNAICSSYRVVATLAREEKTVSQAANNESMDILDSSYSDVATFKAAMDGVQLVYELATPVTYTLTAEQIKTLFGLNNVWADTGDILSLSFAEEEKDGTDLTLVTTGEKYIWDNKADQYVATTSLNGLMSATDKTKLDGVATGATANSISAVSVTAAAGSWTSATPPTQDVSVTGVTANNTIVVSIASTATQAQYEAAASAKLLCTAQGVGTITLTCYGTEPTENIPISVLIVG